MNNRAQALRQLINATPTKLSESFYKWGNLYYQVKPISEIKKKGTRGGNITKYIYVEYAGTKYGIWELTPKMVKKLGLDNKPSVMI